MAEKELNEIKQKTDIVDLISSYLPIKKAGRNYRGLCPFHSEKTPSFMVSQELQIFKCFGCGKGGDIFSFIEEVEGMEFPEALKMLADRAGVSLPEYKPSPKATHLDRLLKLHSLATEYFHYLLLEHEVGREALKYLKGRGLSEEGIKKFSLGYAPRSWDSLTKFLIKKEFSLGEIIAGGLSIAKEGGRGYFDRFRGRIMFPIKNSAGATLGFSGRILGQGEPKYLNSPETELFKKSEVLYGLDLAKGAIKKENEAIVVEGQTDMITPFMLGTKNIVASLGTALGPAQLKLLKRFTENLALCFDTDLAGQSADRRGITLAEELGLNVKVITLPETYKDPDECARQDFTAWTLAVKKAETVYDYIFSSVLRQNDARTAVGQKKIGDELIPTIAGITNEIVRAHYVKKLAVSLGTTEATILKELSRAGLRSKLPERGAVTLEPKVPLSRQERLEEMVLSLLFIVPLEKSQSVLRKLGRVDFTMERAELFEKTKAYFIDRQNPVKVKVFYDKMDEELKPILARLCFILENEYQEPDNAKSEGLLEEAAKELKKDGYRRRLREISTKIKELEKLAGLKSETEELQAEFVKLSNKLKADG